MRRKKGFTLIELIVYIALIGTFVVGAILFVWDVIYSQKKAFAQQKVSFDGRIAMAKIAYQIRKARAINDIGFNYIDLENDVGNTTINLDSGVIYITIGSVGPLKLTSNQVYVTNLSFTNLGSDDNNSKNIEVSLDLRQVGADTSGHYQAEASFKQAIELDSQFNQARSLLFDVSGANLTVGNKNIEGTTVENSGMGDITIDAVTVSWVGGTDGSQLEEIIIDGDSVWSGVADSGDQLDITDTLLLVGAVALDVDSFSFSRAMDDSLVNIVLTLLDDSVAQAEVVFGSSVPTPPVTPPISPTTIPTSPTSIPTTVPVTCSQYCQQVHNLGGSCVKLKDCSGYNEGSIHECDPPNICCCQ